LSSGTRHSDPLCTAILCPSNLEIICLHSGRLFRSRLVQYSPASHIVFDL